MPLLMVIHCSCSPCSCYLPHHDDDDDDDDENPEP